MIVERPSDLAKLCSALAGAPTVYVDTEFVGEGRYYPEVGAIQIATDERAALIDPLAVRDLTRLFDVLIAHDTEKVFHAGSQDLAIFFGMMGRPVAPVFDVQIAAALLGYEDQISLVKLVHRVTQRSLRKSHAFTDWLRRPLTDKQVEYALEDVRCLAPVHRHLVEELRERDRLGWAREEFRALERAARFAPPDPRQMFRQLRGVERLTGEELSRLREVVAWREETARELNIPATRICMDAVLVELARRPRNSAAALSEVRGLRSDQVRRFGRGMIEAFSRSANAPPPRIERPPSLPQEMEPTVDFLVLCLRSLAAEKRISPGLLANRADLTAIVLHGEKAHVPLLRGWRRKAVGEALLATLQGRATARIAPDTHRVHLDWSKRA
ncbi:MAG: ribonuclease D [Armatimonadota bacterium]